MTSRPGTGILLTFFYSVQYCFIDFRKEYNAPMLILCIYDIEKIACVCGKSQVDAKNSMQECVICECTVCLNAHVHVLHRLLALCAHTRNLNLGEMRWPAAHRYLLYSRPTGWNINEGM